MKKTVSTFGDPEGSRLLSKILEDEYYENGAESEFKLTQTSLQ